MVTASYTNFFILFGPTSQVLSAHFIKRNLPNSSFHLVKYDNSTWTIYIFSRYRPLGTNLTKVLLFELVSSDILLNKYFSFLKVYYWISRKTQVSKFTTLSLHSERESEILSNDRMSNERSVYGKPRMYIASISSTFRNNLFINSC